MGGLEFEKFAETQMGFEIISSITTLLEKLFIVLTAQLPAWHERDDGGEAAELVVNAWRLQKIGLGNGSICIWFLHPTARLLPLECTGDESLHCFMQFFSQYMTNGGIETDKTRTAANRPLYNLYRCKFHI